MSYGILLKGNFVKNKPIFIRQKFMTSKLGIPNEIFKKNRYKFLRLHGDMINPLQNYILTKYNKYEVK